jgi:hypothetical protein
VQQGFHSLVQKLKQRKDGVFLYFNLKIFVSSSTKDFSWKENGPNSPDFKGKKIQIAWFVL